MLGTLTRITTLLVAASILLVGHGLQLIALPVHAQLAGWSAAQIGLTGSFYFLGFIAGCVLNPAVVSSVGHIRTFMVMAAVATVALLAASLFVSVWAWMVFRLATGFALAGLYMVIESWLSDVSPKQQRGTVLAIYTMICLLGMALGQTLMALGTPDGLELFILAAILITIAIVPIGLTKLPSPHPIPFIRFTPRKMIAASRVAVGCAFLAGMVTSAFWTLGPLLGTAFGLESGQIGVMMSLGILGGAVSQLPIGRLSDRTDRRIVIGCVASVGAMVAAAGFVFASTSHLALYTSIFLLGATMMPIYALCIAHASDSSELTMVEVTSVILMIHSIGSIVGPLIVAGLIAATNATSYFAYSAVCLAFAAFWSFFRLVVIERPREHTAQAILPRTTQAIAELTDEQPSD
jgi:MFS family permease